MKYEAQISFTMKETHPDKDCVIGGWKPGKVHTFKDVYSFQSDYGWTEDAAVIYMKHDLAAVANGGKGGRDHIDNVTFRFRKL